MCNLFLVSKDFGSVTVLSDTILVVNAKIVSNGLGFVTIISDATLAINTDTCVPISFANCHKQQDSSFQQDFILQATIILHEQLACSYTSTNLSACLQL